MLRSRPGYFVLCLEVGQVPTFFLACLHICTIYSGAGLGGSDLFFFFYVLCGPGSSGPGLLFFVAWYEWARYEVGQLTRKNM